MSSAQAEENHTIHRVFEGSFTTISNVVLHDDTLSSEAVGLLCRILSLPRDWDVKTAHLRQKYRLGRDKLWRMLNELKAAGYVRLVRARGEDGRMKKAVYYMAADPRSLAHLEPAPAEEKTPRTENPSVDEPRSEKPGPVNAARRESRAHTKETDSTKETGSQKALTRDLKNDGTESVDWRNRLALYRQRGVWPQKWGAPMGHPLCLVPADLVEEWRETNGAAFRAAKPKAPAKTKQTNGFKPIGAAAPKYYRPGTSHD